MLDTIKIQLDFHLPNWLHNRAFTENEVSATRLAIESWGNNYKKWEALNNLLRLWGWQTSDKRTGKKVDGSGGNHPLENNMKRALAQ